MQQDAFENIVSKVVAILRRLQWDKNKFYHKTREKPHQNSKYNQTLSVPRHLASHFNLRIQFSENTPNISHNEKLNMKVRL